VRDDLDRDDRSQRIITNRVGNYLAQSIMNAATIADLKADAAELSELFASLSESERQRFLVLVFGSEV
jgi:hypothetical protein